MDVDDTSNGHIGAGGEADATLILSDEVGETLIAGGGTDDPYNFAAALGLR